MINKLKNVHTNSQIFHEINFNIKNKPYLIKKYSKNWIAQKKWDLEFIKNLDEKAEVNTVQGNAVSGEKNIEKVLLKDYIEDISLEKTKSYLTTFHLFKKFPFLKKDLDIGLIEKNSIVQHLLAWIGPRGSITGFHVDWSENINVQILGKKNFYLVSPDYDKYMYESKRFERISKTSLIDLKNIDYGKNPLFEKVHIEKITLEESDAIFIPRGWWHFVESESVSISVSIHYWNIINFIRDLPLELGKVFLHDIGLYKKNDCACHQMLGTKRVKRG